MQGNGIEEMLRHIGKDRKGDRGCARNLLVTARKRGHRKDDGKEVLSVLCRGMRVLRRNWRCLGRSARRIPQGDIGATYINRWLDKMHRGRPLPILKSIKEQMERICAFCGEVIPDSRKSGNVKYCSTKCERKANLTPSVVGKIIERGKKKSNRHPDLVTAFGYKSAVCGWSIPTWKEGYKNFERQGGCEVHHIIPVSENGSEDSSNLILLCPNCHKMAHCGILTASELKCLTLTLEEIETKTRDYRIEAGVKYSRLLSEKYRH